MKSGEELAKVAVDGSIVRHRRKAKQGVKVGSIAGYLRPSVILTSQQNQTNEMGALELNPFLDSNGLHFDDILSAIMPSLTAIQLVIISQFGAIILLLVVDGTTIKVGASLSITTRPFQLEACYIHGSGSHRNDRQAEFFSLSKLNFEIGRAHCYIWFNNVMC